MSDGNNRTQGRKKSLFPSKTEVPSGSKFDFVSSSTNYSILYEDLLAALGATGTIQQLGASTGIPVLDIQGSDNFIRNLEPTAGISAEISSEGGISFGLDLTVNTDGVPVLEVDGAGAITATSLVATGGISAVADGAGRITLALTDAPTTTKTVIVSAVSDLPPALGSVIELDTDTDYLFVNDVNLGTNRLALPASCTVRSGSQELITLTYTGAGALFTGTDVNFLTYGMLLSCQNGSLYDIDGATSGVQTLETTIFCDSGGVIDGVAIVRFDACLWAEIGTEGILFQGNINTLLIKQSVIVDLNGTMFDLGSCVCNSLIIDTVIVQDSQSGSFFLSGATSSANLVANGLASLTNTRFNGDGDPLDGITVNDVRWSFLGNDKIEDTYQNSLLIMEGNATQTVIAVVGDDYLVLGTWTSGNQSFFTGDAAGRVTYIGERNLQANIDVTATVLATGGDKQVGMMIAINGTPVSATKHVATASGSKAASITAFWGHDFAPGDYLEVFVSNESNVSNVTCQQAVIRVR